MLNLSPAGSEAGGSLKYSNSLKPTRDLSTVQPGAGDKVDEIRGSMVRSTSKNTISTLNLVGGGNYNILN